MNQAILVTGGAGFIGSNFVHLCMEKYGVPVVNLDLLTYAGNSENLAEFENYPGYTLVHGDICNAECVEAVLAAHQPRAVVHFAAESHVDRSIVGPQAFINTNVVGTFHLLQSVRNYWQQLAPEAQKIFRFLHVSTDEVYGSLGSDDPAFLETTPYAPNSPYSASKAASDHLVRAYNHTYGLPTLTTNCSNNYGPYQFPEKLIPLMILNALEGKKLPVYGDGGNVRDWLYVTDHCNAIMEVLTKGVPGSTYNIGGHNELTNVEVVDAICDILDELRPDAQIGPRRSLIAFIQDRLGHDRRYAINASKIERELGWVPSISFPEGLRRTVEWYLSHTEWVRHVQSGEYRQWITTNYSGRAL